MKYLKERKAITLIALIITIIILFILAGVTVVILTNSGLFDKAKTAKQESENAEELEKTKIAEYNNEIDSYLDGNRGTVTLTQEEYEILKNANSYSLEEKIIGTSINGKPLYQKTFSTTTSATSGEIVNVDISAIPIDEVLEFYGVIKTSDTPSYAPINTVCDVSSTYTNGTDTWLNVGSNLRIRSNIYLNRPVRITLKYTKTTD